MIQLERIDEEYMKATLVDTDAFRYTIPKLLQSQQYSVLETLLGEVEQSARDRCVPKVVENHDDDMVDVD